MVSSREVMRSPAQEVLEKFGVDAAQGLNQKQVEKKREKYGWNRLKETKKRSTWDIFIDQFKSPIIGLLAAAAVLAFTFQEWIEGIAVVIAIALNAIIGFTTELRAVKSMQSLQALSRSQAKVRREGQVQQINADKLVPGDIVVLEGGDLVPADIRLIEASKLQADESALTGESMPASKNIDPVDSDEVPLAEQTNRLFKGTAITRGSGEGIVTATGMETELGHISELAEQAGAEQTPLEKRLDQLGRRLIWVTLGVAVVVALAGIVQGKDLVLMVETAIALSVAAVPEGLPIVATVALARGMWRMAQQNALINRLSAVETLGSTSIVCTDKTGTLTQNRMTVSQIVLHDKTVQVTNQEDQPFRMGDDAVNPMETEALKRLLEVGVLCNNAELPDMGESEKIIGDPMEISLLEVGRKAELERSQLRDRTPEEREVAFDPEVKMMATFHQGEQGYWVAVKGAPETVLQNCTQQWTTDGPQPLEKEARDRWEQRLQETAEAGLRVLAFATKSVDSPKAQPYENLIFLGAMGMEDPPREGVKDAIRACHDAGVRVIMVTGDQPITARNIGVAVGVVSDQDARALPGSALKPLDDLTRQRRQELQQVSVFARVSPEQKLNLIALHQHDGDIVAMTGDGVNDAPALQKADIGVAMGQRGTQVAQDASDMVLQDDAFSTIVAAIAQGRAIFRNIRQFTLYLLSGNTGEIIAVALASLFNAPLPLLPLQILYINAVNDVFPALALGFGEGHELMMKRPPRKNEAVLTQRHWTQIVLYGLLIAGATLGAFAIALQVWQLNDTQAVTVSFMTLAFARLWHIFNMRTQGSGLLSNEVVRNRYVWGALVICTGILLGAVYIPGLSGVLGTTGLSPRAWGLVFGASLIPLVVGQIGKLLLENRRHSQS